MSRRLSLTTISPTTETFWSLWLLHQATWFSSIRQMVRNTQPILLATKQKPPWFSSKSGLNRAVTVLGSSKPCGNAFLVDFFNGLDVESNGPTPLDNYYKRWFDNVQAYQENKEKRINETKISDSSEVVDSKRICTEKS